MALAIEIENLRVRYKTRTGPVDAVSDLSLAVKEGEVLGFLGPNGAGKTTTMHVLLGFIEATGGTARILGTDVRRSIARRRIGYLPENPQMYRFLTGYELLYMAGRIFGMEGSRLRRRIGELLEMMGLTAAARRRISTYSRGMLQRIGLVEALIHDPDLLLLDEPTGGMDPLGRVEIREQIRKLKAAGKTIFFSSHELSEVERVCDRIVIIHNGRKLVEGRLEDLIPEGTGLEEYFLRTIGREQ